MKSENSTPTAPAKTDREPVRAPWLRPKLRVFDASDAGTGVNSTTDLTNTFS